MDSLAIMFPCPPPPNEVLELTQFIPLLGRDFQCTDCKLPSEPGFQVAFGPGK